MIVIAEHELQRVRSRRQVHDCLSLSGTEMKVIEIVRNWVIQGRQL